MPTNYKGLLPYLMHRKNAHEQKKAPPLIVKRVQTFHENDVKSNTQCTITEYDHYCGTQVILALLKKFIK